MPNYSYILLPKFQDIILPNAPVKFNGMYRMQVKSTGDGSVRRDTGWFPNLITTLGLNQIGSANPIDRCCIGTGTTTPSIADTGLATFAASTTNPTPGFPQIGNEGSPNYANYKQFGYRFNAGQLNGNYSEVGVGWTNTSLWSRALILDGVGSPTTITVLSTEYLDVFYMIRTVPDLTEYTSSVTISGVTYSVKRKPANVNNLSYWNFRNAAMRWAGSSVSVNIGLTYTSVLGGVTSTPSSQAGSTASASTENSYVSNSFEKTGSVTWALTEGNTGSGIKSIVITGAAQQYQYEFDTVLPKDSTKQLTLNGKVSWS